MSSRLVTLLCLPGLLLSGSLLQAAPRTPQERQVDNAVSRALNFLSREQNPDGSWNIGNQPSTAATSLAVMAFLAGGYVPDEGPYGMQITRGINWVIASQNGNGMLDNTGGHGAMYSHGISTLMLAEVIGMLNKDLAKDVKRSLERAVKVILNAQNVRKPVEHAGGWRYGPDSRDSDLSVTGWQLLALRASKNVGCDVPAENIDAAIAYVKNCSSPGNSGFGYMGRHGSSPTMTGTGIVGLEVCGEHHCEEVLGGARYLLSRPIRQHDNYFYYGVYYTSVGMFKVGGRYWEGSKTHIIQELTSLQQADGSWCGRGSEQGPGPVYATSLAVLALAVEYQYLPIYQR